MILVFCPLDHRTLPLSWQTPAPQPALGPPGSSEELEPCHHPRCETAVAQQMSSQRSTKAAAEPEQNKPQVSLHCTPRCPQWVSSTLNEACSEATEASALTLNLLVSVNNTCHKIKTQNKHRQHVSGLWAGAEAVFLSPGQLPAVSLFNLSVHHILPWSLSWHCGQTHSTASMTLIITTAEPVHMCGTAAPSARRVVVCALSVSLIKS